MNIKKAFINTTLALSLAFSASPLAANAAAFEDIAGHWADGAIQWAKDNKITGGYPDGTFQPNRVVSEEEFVAMLMNSFSTPNLGTKINRWSDGVYAVANYFNYPVASNNNTKATPLKRYRVAEIVAGTQGKNYNGDNAIQYVMGSGLASGKVAGQFTIASFKGNDTLTRGEAVAFIQKLKQNPNASKTLLARPTTPSPVSELPSLGGVNPPAPTDKITDENGDIKLEVARSYEMQVHNSYKFGKDNMTLTLPMLPKGYAWDIGLFVDYKDGSDDFLGYGLPFSVGKSYTVDVDWNKVKEGTFKVGIMDLKNGSIRRYSYYQYSTKKIVEKVSY
ncbi:putative S-layer protein [Schinkia azotoformans MEV2011]|uniref:Putative S-layer protein n=1 Tax=Schinkia azotoformans MEV2011 TaxID=1348973 RepID=A0A072NFH1_SCHAZ|nr:S-layer homology domain-containing protein [Schinkia azotoformans]KEF36291.1 putative S-layer protein [Schinkia azotoformans MEV2011]MEC1697874.1 S-layer homology domain-containing protein [Schinkia azotoformans]MEC1723153.1 S-layer homology domain-containing protein [Schinkia azotoformans]MEC1771873.1 S-layer homology domain-containing protein [Schinkia azotoformans]MEC1780275.1 S-layer homology domain-containing protein [Schinkia azotoformans]